MGNLINTMVERRRLENEAMAERLRLENEAMAERLRLENEAIALKNDALRRENEQRQAEESASVETIAKTPSSKDEARALRHSIDAISPQLRNPWSTEEGIVPMRSPEKLDDKLRANVANHYHCRKNRKLANGKTVVIAKCCVTQKEGDHTQVIAAHLLPRRCPTRTVKELKLADAPHGIDDYRNIVLLSYNIEKAFDRQELCFVKSADDDGGPILKILKPTVKSLPIFKGSAETIGKYEGQKMEFCEGTGPYTRILSLHAQWSYFVAKQNNWIPPDTPVPQDYGSPVTQDVVHCLPMSLSECTDWSDVTVDSKVVPPSQTMSTEPTSGTASVSEETSTH